MRIEWSCESDWYIGWAPVPKGDETVLLFRGKKNRLLNARLENMYVCMHVDDEICTSVSGKVYGYLYGCIPNRLEDWRASLALPSLFNASTDFGQSWQVSVTHKRIMAGGVEGSMVICWPWGYFFKVVLKDDAFLLTGWDRKTIHAYEHRPSDGSATLRPKEESISTWISYR